MLFCGEKRKVVKTKNEEQFLNQVVLCVIVKNQEL